MENKNTVDTILLQFNQMLVVLQATIKKEIQLYEMRLYEAKCFWKGLSLN
jgi:hypothetical protein